MPPKTLLNSTELQQKRQELHTLIFAAIKDEEDHEEGSARAYQGSSLKVEDVKKYLRRYKGEQLQQILRTVSVNRYSHLYDLVNIESSNPEINEELIKYILSISEDRTKTFFFQTRGKNDASILQTAIEKLDESIAQEIFGETKLALPSGSDGTHPYHELLTSQDLGGYNLIHTSIISENHRKLMLLSNELRETFAGEDEYKYKKLLMQLTGDGSNIFHLAVQTESIDMFCEVLKVLEKVFGIEDAISISRTMLNQKNFSGLTPNEVITSSNHIIAAIYNNIFQRFASRAPSAAAEGKATHKAEELGEVVTQKEVVSSAAAAAKPKKKKGGVKRKKIDENLDMQLDDFYQTSKQLAVHDLDLTQAKTYESIQIEAIKKKFNKSLEGRIKNLIALENIECRGCLNKAFNYPFEKILMPIAANYTLEDFAKTISLVAKALCENLDEYEAKKTIITLTAQIFICMIEKYQIMRGGKKLHLNEFTYLCNFFVQNWSREVIKLCYYGFVNVPFNELFRERGIFSENDLKMLICRINILEDNETLDSRCNNICIPLRESYICHVSDREKFMNFMKETLENFNFIPGILLHYLINGFIMYKFYHNNLEPYVGLCILLNWALTVDEPVVSKQELISTKIGMLKYERTPLKKVVYTLVDLLEKFLPSLEENLKAAKIEVTPHSLSLQRSCIEKLIVKVKELRESSKSESSATAVPVTDIAAAASMPPADKEALKEAAALKITSWAHKIVNSTLKATSASIE